MAIVTARGGGWAKTVVGRDDVSCRTEAAIAVSMASCQIVKTLDRTLR